MARHTKSWNEGNETNRSWRRTERSRNRSDRSRNRSDRSRNRTDRSSNRWERSWNRSERSRNRWERSWKGPERNRSTLTHKIGYALLHPGRIAPYLRRATRDAWLRLRHPDHVGYYRAVMASDTRRDPEAAVGSRSHERWLALGRMQFDYLLGHGLRPEHKMLDIGCGNLRGGWRFIDHLDPGNYYGIDISPDILIAAKKTLTERRLQHKLPHLTLTGDLTLDFLPSDHFDVVHAHSVFSHSPLHVIEECLAHVGRVLTDEGFFDFTFDRTEGAEHQVLREDFYYRAETLLSLARAHGLSARLMDDWEQLPHGQSKIRVRRSPLPDEAPPA